jgi:hypothetical protein
MRRRTAALAAALAGLAFGCGDSATKGTYTLELTAYDPHVGQRVFLKVKDATGATTLGSAQATVSSTGTATLSVANVLESGKRYRADWFVDSVPAGSPNGTYDPPTGPLPGGIQDHSWRNEFPGSATGVTQSRSHDTNWSDLSPF